ncbi:MAG TPA: hypothetical protein VEA77_01300 [Hyphomicrobium sp.]|nr:hypothetical protein [Hyphomicrobium sp.]
MPRRSIAFLLIALSTLPTAALAQLTHKIGKVTMVFADPADVVVQLSVNGPCGSNFYHIKRSAVNFKEMFEITMTAFETGRNLGLFVKPVCEGTRNVVNHGNVML